MPPEKISDLLAASREPVSIFELVNEDGKELEDYIPADEETPETISMTKSDLAGLRELIFSCFDTSKESQTILLSCRW